MNVTMNTLFALFCLQNFTGTRLKTETSEGALYSPFESPWRFQRSDTTSSG